MTTADAIVLIAFVFLALVPTIAAFALKSGRWILAVVASGGWALLGVFNYTQSSELWDIYYSLFWLSMGMTIVCILVPTLLREKKEADIDPLEGVDEEDKPLIADYQADNKDRKRVDMLMGRKRRRPRPRLSSFAKTGKEKRRFSK
jgi:hypothetical protein